MKYSTRLSDAVHVMVFIALSGSDRLSSDAIATSVRTNPSCVRLLMSQLKAAGLMDSVRGHARPTLSRAPEEITLLDVYRAVEGDKPLLHLDTHTNPECGIGVNIQYALQDFFDEVQKSAEEKMASITLADVLERFGQKAGSPIELERIIIPEA